MRRRSFIAGAATLAVPPMRALAAPPPDDAVPADGARAHRWTLAHGTSRYVIALDDAALTCDCLGPAAAADGGEAPIAPLPAAAQPVLLATGTRRTPVSWQVADAQTQDPLTLRLSLRAVALPLAADVAFAIDAASGILVRRTTVRHTGEGPPVTVRASQSIWLGIHERVDHLVYLSGSWAAEMETQRDRALSGPLLLESRVGKTGFGAQPYVALRASGSTYLCQIFWSGNWALRVTPHAQGAAVLGGLNSWRFRHKLMPDAALTLPAALAGRFEGDLNAATRRLHDYRRATRPDPDRAIPVQFNTWYPYFGEPTAAAMLPMIPQARRLGCEAFVVDAGWYRTDDGDAGDDAEADWAARTGDWRTSRRRFPRGLREVSRACRDSGMLFGLWFEPEVIGQLSPLRREHPEWLHHIDGHAPAPADRAVLNLGVPEARRHATERIARIIELVGVDWMKWDFNADLGAGGWAPGLPDALTGQDPLVAHYRGLYAMQDELRARFPALLLEMCASGGGRMDGEILSHAHVNWMSDQPSALRKLAIHFGSQLAHPAVDCNDWLVEWPPGPVAGYDDDEPQVAELGDLAFRLRVAMLGSFGISARIDRWSHADTALAAEHVRLYAERLRPIIHHGDQHLLTHGPPPGPDGDWAAVWYVAKDGLSGALFAFRLASAHETRRFALPGLRADRRYRVADVDADDGEETGASLAGGLAVTLRGRYRSGLHVIEAV
ncbi:MAG: alpha-galactosidase [Proteobacteria bacterium]|nr:alpha-galactosidase [Pseudomonadota bacterium]